MDAADLRAFRERAGLKQVEMALLVGMSPRAYQDLEGGASELRHVHALALERASLSLALERRDISLALPAVRKDSLDLVALIRGE